MKYNVFAHKKFVLNRGGGGAQARRYNDLNGNSNVRAIEFYVKINKRFNVGVDTVEKLWMLEWWDPIENVTPGYPDPLINLTTTLYTNIYFKS